MRWDSTTAMELGTALGRMALFMNLPHRFICFKWRGYRVIKMYKVQIMKKLDVLSGSSAESFQQQSSCRSTQVRVYKKEEHELLPGQFFSDEPGLYIEGEFGIRLETVLRWQSRNAICNE